MTKLLILVMCWMSLVCPSHQVQPDLGFLYPIGLTQLPQTADVTTYAFQYVYERTKFYFHNDTLYNLRSILTNGSAFTTYPKYDDSLSTLANNTILLINQTLETLHDIKYITDRDLVHGQAAAVNQTIEINSDFWFIETKFSEISQLMALVKNSKDYTYEEGYEKSSTFREFLVDMINLNGEIAKYHNQLLQLLRIIRGAQQQHITDATVQILAKYICEIPEDSYIHSTKVTYFSSGLGTLEFEVKVIVYGQMETFKEYKSVPYMNFKLNKTYYSDQPLTRLFTIHCDNDLCYEIENDTCAKDLYSKELASILQHCDFEYENVSYEITDQGIFIYSTPPEDLQALIKKHGFTVDRYPTLIQFKDCYKLKQGNLLVSGCMDLGPRQFVSRYNQDSLKSYIDPNFGYMVYKVLKNEPWSVAMWSLPVLSLLAIFATYKCLTCMCCSKPKYKKVVDQEAHINYTSKKRRHNRSSRSSRSNRSRTSAQ